MDQSIIVSVLMLAYNAERFIKEAIDSVLGQTYENFELIIIDDASTDKTPEIILAYEDKRIRYFRNPENMGIRASRIRSLAEARGIYTAILDSDDVTSPDRLEKQVQFLESHKDFGVIASCFQSIDEFGKVTSKDMLTPESLTRQLSPTLRNGPKNHTDTITNLLFRNVICNSTTMARTDLIRSIGYHPAYPLSEDYYLWYTASKHAKICVLPFIGTKYRIHHQSTTRKNWEVMIEMEKNMAELILNDLAIDYSPSELDTHSNFLLLNHQYYQTLNELDKLEKWLIKLTSSLRKSQNLNQKLAFDIVIEYWAQICKKEGRFSRILWNQLLQEKPVRYICNVSDTIIKKFTHIGIR